MDGKLIQWMPFIRKKHLGNSQLRLRKTSKRIGEEAQERRQTQSQS
jgi:hypothetical protein